MRSLTSIGEVYFKYMIGASPSMPVNFQPFPSGCHSTGFAKLLLHKIAYCNLFHMTCCVNASSLGGKNADFIGMNLWLFVYSHECPACM